MYTEEVYFHVENNRLAGTRILEEAGAIPSILSLHGAGQATRNRIKYLLKDLVPLKLSSFCFDFSGHGESEGSLELSSLSLRRKEALIACDFIENRSPKAVIASSMGAHVAALLSKQVSIATLVLFCPAAYAAEAEDVRFDSRFSQIIREPNSYVDSLAFSSIEEFEGNLLVICGSEDKTIPRDIVHSYVDRAHSAKSKKLLWINGAGHQIHGFLESNSQERTRIVTEIFGLL